MDWKEEMKPPSGQQRRTGQSPRRDNQVRVRDLVQPRQHILGNRGLEAVELRHIAVEGRDRAALALLHRNQIGIERIPAGNRVVHRART